MRTRDMQTLWAYSWWATERVLNAADGIDHEEFIRPGPIPYGSLRDTLVHMFDTEQSARRRLAGKPSQEPVDPATYATASDLARDWNEEATAMNEYLRSLHDDDLENEFELRESERYPYWQLLLHVFNHSTQHRSEAAVLLTERGRSPGDLDLYLFLRQSR